MTEQPEGPLDGGHVAGSGLAYGIGEVAALLDCEADATVRGRRRRDREGMLLCWAALTMQREKAELPGYLAERPPITRRERQVPRIVRELLYTLDNPAPGADERRSDELGLDEEHGVCCDTADPEPPGPPRCDITADGQ